MQFSCSKAASKLAAAVVGLGLGLAAATGVQAAGSLESKVFDIGPVKLKRIYYDERVLPDRTHAGFGSLLFDTEGRLALHDGTKTWLYTTAPASEEGGDWVSHAREFDVESFVSGEKTEVLPLAVGDKWAVIHNAMKVRDDLYVVFYSNGKMVRAAVSDRPDGRFEVDADFKLAITDDWERRGGAPEKSSLESNGGYVKISESKDELVFWEIYGSYHSDFTRGRLGWAKVRLDKTTGDLDLLEKHAGNPLDIRPPHYIAARGGGNLASDVKLGGQHTLFYYTRPTRDVILAAVALAEDPLFQDITFRREFDRPLGEEAIIEKFEAYRREDRLYLIYENKLNDGQWRTGIRVYQILE